MHLTGGCLYTHTPCSKTGRVPDILCIPRQGRIHLTGISQGGVACLLPPSVSPRRYEDVFDASQYMGLMVTLFVILFASHLMACSWYLIGIGESVGSDGE